MPTIEGVNCYISTATGKLNEYTDAETGTDHLDENKEPTGRLRSCYVQVQHDAEFDITVELGSFPDYHPEATDLAVYFSIDGVCRQPAGCLLKFGARKGIYDNYYSTISPGFVETLKFATLDVTGDHDLCTATEDVNFQRLGEFEVLLYRWRRLSEVWSVEPAPSITETPSRPAATKVHEKELKGKDISHVVSTGTMRKWTSKSYPSGDFVDPRMGEPYMTFRFLYRSERMAPLPLV